MPLKKDKKGHLLDIVMEQTFTIESIFICTKAFWNPLHKENMEVNSYTGADIEAVQIVCHNVSLIGNEIGGSRHTNYPAECNIDEP